MSAKGTLMPKIIAIYFLPKSLTPWNNKHGIYHTTNMLHIDSVADCGCLCMLTFIL